MATKFSRPSCVDVAKHAGVSQATVSRVFSQNAAPVSAKSRDKVLKAAAELNYHPNIIARGLSKNSTQIIGVIVTRFDNSFYTESLQHFTHILQDAGYTAMVLNFDPLDVESALPLAFQYQVDGIIIASGTISKAVVSRCAELGTPVVAYNRHYATLPINAVSADYFRIGGEVAEYLCRLGHRRPVFLGGDLDFIPPIKDRLAGFINGLQGSGVEPLAPVQGGNQYEAGYELAAKLLKKTPRPDALFCCNYMVAVGAIDAARELYGMAIPDELSVVGFYDHPIAGSASYRLTTVNLPVEDIARAAVEILLNAIKTRSTAVTMRMFPGEIVERGSVKDRR